MKNALALPYAIAEVTIIMKRMNSTLSHMKSLPVRNAIPHLAMVRFITENWIAASSLSILRSRPHVALALDEHLVLRVEEAVGPASGHLAILARPIPVDANTGDRLVHLDLHGAAGTAFVPSPAKRRRLDQARSAACASRHSRYAERQQNHLLLRHRPSPSSLLWFREKKIWLAPAPKYA